jgi:hypothetical protein
MGLFANHNADGFRLQVPLLEGLGGNYFGCPQPFSRVRLIFDTTAAAMCEDAPPRMAGLPCLIRHKEQYIVRKGKKERHLVLIPSLNLLLKYNSPTCAIYN